VHGAKQITIENNENEFKFSAFFAFSIFNWELFLRFMEIDRGSQSVGAHLELCNFNERDS
jgi:hypothetical protein